VILFLISLIDFIFKLFILLLIVHVVLSYFMSPFHPIRERVDRIVEPMLRPIRKLIPSVGMFDFSPLILMLLAQIINLIFKNILISLL
jgi:YggT family protein